MKILDNKMIYIIKYKCLKKYIKIINKNEIINYSSIISQLKLLNLFLIYLLYVFVFYILFNLFILIIIYFNFIII